VASFPRTLPAAGARAGELAADEQAYAVAVIDRWIDRELDAV
jgi:hypothetical protein